MGIANLALAAERQKLHPLKSPFSAAAPPKIAKNQNF